MRFITYKKRCRFDNEVQKFIGREITRREFIRQGAALGISAAILTDVVGLFDIAHAGERPSSKVLGKIRREGGSLSICNSKKVFHKDTIPDFEKEFGVSVTHDTFFNNYRLFAQIQAGSGKYDVIAPSISFVPAYISRNLLAPLDLENIPNIKFLFPKFLETAADPGCKYSIPDAWGIFCMAHHMGYTRGDPNVNSWGLVFESVPAKYSGKLGLMDEKEAVFAIALNYLGCSVNTRLKSEIKEAGSLLMKTKPHIKAFYPVANQRKALITEEIIVAHGSSREIVKANWENHKIKPIIPKEGATGWCDTNAIPKNARHKFTAEIFLNYLNRPDVAARNSSATGYSTANKEAVAKFTNRKIAKNPYIYPTNRELARVEFLNIIPGKLMPIYDQIWTRLTGNA